MKGHLNITALPAFKDNYIWFVDTGRATIAVDPGDPAPVERMLDELGRPLDEIWITHHHPDHTGGIRALVEHFPEVTVRGPAGASPFLTQPLFGGETFHPRKDERFTVNVKATPGHTLDHVCLELVDAPQRHLFSGDTLFAGGCGRLFEGTPSQMFGSLKSLLELPDDTLVYPAHEYTLNNLVFARSVEPANASIDARLDKVKRIRERDIPSLPVSLGEEVATNPFVRIVLGKFETTVLMSSLSNSLDPVDLFANVRKLKDKY